MKHFGNKTPREVYIEALATFDAAKKLYLSAHKTVEQRVLDRDDAWDKRNNALKKSGAVADMIAEHCETQPTDNKPSPKLIKFIMDHTEAAKLNDHHAVLGALSNLKESFDADLKECEDELAKAEQAVSEARDMESHSLMKVVDAEARFVKAEDTLIVEQGEEAEESDEQEGPGGKKHPRN